MYKLLSFKHLSMLSILSSIKHFEKNVIVRCLRLDYDFKEPRVNSTWMEPYGYDTGIQIYNPVVKNKVQLILRNDKLVKWYSCGPTVYDSAHIGHATCYVKLDIIRRILLNYFDLNVFMMMGITDIDDKIISRSVEQKEDFRSLANRYEVEFFNDMSKLNVMEPSVTARVTDHIPDIILFIKQIVDKGHAYATPQGSVYFSVKDFTGYGKLFPAVPDSDSPNTTEKRSPLDFSLWKAVKPGEPFWESPWGKGRPGWHIECSTMASKVLGPNIDVHSGGIDLVFPHHENEEAQSCAHHEIPQWINYWIHTGHLYLRGDQKMSKSLKNTISIREFLNSYTDNHLRVLCLLSHYRNGIEYSDEHMSLAVGTYRRIESFLDDCHNYVSGVKDTGDINEIELLKSLQNTKSSILTSLADDFDTSKVMNSLMLLIGQTNTMLRKELENGAKPVRRPVAVAAVADFVKRTIENFGISSKVSAGNSSQFSKILDSAVEFRSVVRQVALTSEMNKQAKPQRIELLKACDNLRNDLTACGIELKDHKSKSSWNIMEKADTNKHIT